MGFAATWIRKEKVFTMKLKSIGTETKRMRNKGSTTPEWYGPGVTDSAYDSLANRVFKRVAEVIDYLS